MVWSIDRERIACRAIVTSTTENTCVKRLVYWLIAAPGNIGVLRDVLAELDTTLKQVCLRNVFARKRYTKLKGNGAEQLFTRLLQAVLHPNSAIDRVDLVLRVLALFDSGRAPIIRVDEFFDAHLPLQTWLLTFAVDLHEFELAIKLARGSLDHGIEPAKFIDADGRNVWVWDWMESHWLCQMNPYLANKNPTDKMTIDDWRTVLCLTNNFGARMEFVLNTLGAFLPKACIDADHVFPMDADCTDHVFSCIFQAGINQTFRQYWKSRADNESFSAEAFADLVFRNTDALI